MAERRYDLADVLRAAEAERGRTLATTPMEDALARVRTGVRTARRRRAALAVTGAAAAVVVAAGAVLWSPRPAAVPAGPSSTTPTPTTSVTPPFLETAAPPPGPSAVPVVVGGLPPLVPAGPDDLRDAAPGSVLALWTPTTLSTLEGGDAAPGEAHVVLVTPEGGLRHVVRAPDRAIGVTAWDRGAATAVVTTADGGGGGSVVVDLLTGRTSGAVDREWNDALRSPDGSTTAEAQGAAVLLTTADVQRTIELPSQWCVPAGWVDETGLLVTCTDRAPESPVPGHTDGPSLLLLDTVTGETQRRALTTGDVVPTGARGVRTQDGALITPVDVVGRDVDVEAVGRVCGTGLGRFDGLVGAALPDVPAADLLHPGLVAAPGRVVLAGPTACATDLAPSGMWTLDLATGRVDELLPVVDHPDAPYGLLSWTTWS